jgi:hypothetical protein
MEVRPLTLGVLADNSVVNLGPPLVLRPGDHAL